jgi:hypothetical protein
MVGNEKIEKNAREYGLHARNFLACKWGYNK